jgi:hypothetical protein
MWLKILSSSKADGTPSVMERQQVSRVLPSIPPFRRVWTKDRIAFLVLLYYYLLRSMFLFVGWFAGENELLQLTRR